MSNDTKDFVGELTPTVVKLTTYDNTKTATLLKGVLRWHWHDTEGKLHRFDIPDSYYDPDGTRLLSPQHWAKSQKRYHSTIQYIGNDSEIILSWANTMVRIPYNTNGVADLIVFNQDNCELLANKTNNKVQVQQLTYTQLWNTVSDHQNSHYLKIDPNCASNRCHTFHCNYQ